MFTHHIVLLKFYCLLVGKGVLYKYFKPCNTRIWPKCLGIFRDSSKLKEGWEIKTIESSGESPKYRTLTSVIYSALQGFPFSLPTLKFEVLFFTSFLRHYKNMKRDWRDQLEVCLYIRKLKNKYLVYESKKIRIKFVKTKS